LVYTLHLQSFFINLDLKVGTRQYGDGASITKQRSKTAKVESSTR
ncbi:MAG: inositol polyphosphate kinase family protein, partial [Mesoflavibacter sp.]|nr:inositol polyphosphate kinase family protein [Mesoflavibacter sp.]